MDKILNLDNVDQYNSLYGLETLNPLVSVIDLNKATRQMDYVHWNYGVYALYLKLEKACDIKYGRRSYDYQEGTVVCMAPGQVIGIDNRKKTPQRTKSIGVLFHPDLIRGTSLGQNIKNYSFFSYEVNEALHLSEQEKEIVTDCIHKIQIELEHAIEKAIIICDNETLPAELFQLARRTGTPEAAASTLEEMEMQMIRKTLDKCSGNLSAVAAQLGITRQTLYNKMKKYGL